jgi:hypothetical protein
MKSFSQYWIISMVDFAKNYSFQVQNEVQNMHWHSYQINILVHITFQSNPNFDVHVEDSKSLMNIIFTSPMIVSTILNLCNIFLASIRGTFQTKGFPQDGITCGLMGVLINLSLQNLGILYQCILT